MTRVVNRLPFRLGGLIGTGAAPYANTKAKYDYAIGGVPFLSHERPDSPFVRQTAAYRKDQFDNSADPGEQSLATWWLRSQSSFHGGAGNNFEIPLSSGVRDENRFADSLGVDVWTPGKVKLLPLTSLRAAASGGIKVLGAATGGSDFYLQADGTALYRVASSGSPVALTWGGAGTILSLAYDGSRYYAADATGIYRDTLPTSGAGAGALLWNTGASPVTLAWVKQRLMAGIGASIYELVSGGPALPAATYTHPNSNWQWTSIVAGPTAIYAAGYAGSESAIFKLSLSSAAVPVVNSTVEAVSLPPGEYVTALYEYLGRYLLIGTNRGVRVGIIDDSGNVTYGGLSIVSTTPVYGFTGRDRFVYTTCTNTIGGASGLYRIDLNQQNDFDLYAYASDLQTHVTGVCSGVTQLGATGQLVIAVNAAGSYLESATELETIGTLTTERIRFHTLDEKVFKYLRVRCAPITAGTIGVSQIDQIGNETSIITFGTTTPIPEEVALSTNPTQQEFMQFKFTLHPTGTASPELHGYQLKALPAAKRQREFVFTVLCYDHERDSVGNNAGRAGWALDRITALEELENVGDTILFQDLSINESRLCVIDKLQLQKLAPPAGTSGFGGLLVITLRAVT